jgi:hypothetical protein
MPPTAIGRAKRRKKAMLSSVAANRIKSTGTPNTLGTVATVYTACAETISDDTSTNATPPVQTKNAEDTGLYDRETSPNAAPKARSGRAPIPSRIACARLDRESTQRRHARWTRVLASYFAQGLDAPDRVHECPTPWSFRYRRCVKAPRRGQLGGGVFHVPCAADPKRLPCKQGLVI